MFFTTISTQSSLLSKRTLVSVFVFTLLIELLSLSQLEAAFELEYYFGWQARVQRGSRIRRRTLAQRRNLRRNPGRQRYRNRELLFPGTLETRLSRVLALNLAGRALGISDRLGNDLLGPYGLLTPAGLDDLTDGLLGNHSPKAVLNAESPDSLVNQRNNQLKPLEGRLKDETLSPEVLLATIAILAALNQYGVPLRGQFRPEESEFRPLRPAENLRSDLADKSRDLASLNADETLVTAIGASLAFSMAANGDSSLGSLAASAGALTGGAEGVKGAGFGAGFGAALAGAGHSASLAAAAGGALGNALGGLPGAVIGANLGLGIGAQIETEKRR